MKKIAIIGAGIAGLTIGHILQSEGMEVELFDKGRSVGGRMSSRRTDWGYLDHGCQYVTVKDSLFADFLSQWQNVLIEWKGNFARWQNGNLQAITIDSRRYTPFTAMNRLAKAIAESLSVKVLTRITNLKKNDRGWLLIDREGNEYGSYDLVIVTAPPAQTFDLLKGHTSIAQQVNEVSMLPCFTSMVILEKTIEFEFDGIEFEHPVLGWFGVNNTKPNRGDKTSLVIQSNFTWATDHLNDDRQIIEQTLQDNTREIFNIDSWGQILYQSLHLWRYAVPSQKNDNRYYLDTDNSIAICGDWCLKGKIEGAFLSAYHLSQKLLANKLSPTNGEI